MENEEKEVLNEETTEQKPEVQKKGFFAKTSIKIAVIAAAAVVAVGALTVGLVRADVFTNPDKAIDNALESLTTDGGVSEFEKVFGYSELCLNILEQGADAEVLVSVSDIPMDEFGLPGYTIPNAGVSVKALVDIVNRKFDYTVGLQLANTNMLDMKVYVDEQEAVIAVPQLLSSLLSVRYSEENYVEKLQNSYLAQLLSINPELWAALAETESIQPQTNAEQKMEEAIQVFDEIIAKITATRITERVDAKLLNVNGKEVKCKGYKATYKEEAVREFVDEWIEMYSSAFNQALAGEMSAEMQELFDVVRDISDVELVIYTNNKRVARIEMTTEVSGNNVELYLDLTTKGNYFDNMEVRLKVETPEVDVDLKLTHATENTEEAYKSEWKASINGVKMTAVSEYDKKLGDISFEVNAGDAGEIRCSGAITELEKGQSLGFMLDEMTVSESGETTTVPFDLKVSLAALNQEITAPSGEKKEITAMTEEEWNALIFEAYLKIMTIANSLSGLIQ